ncbi:MAG: FtsX-like permease family protein [Acidobacteriota bacterium]|nr:FtsX-like permease family protein [Acidobacteriota bacterium]
MRFTTFLAIFTTAFAVAVMILAMALSRGFSHQIQKAILENEPHVKIFRKDGESLDNWQFIKERLEYEEQIVSLEPLFYQGAFVFSDETSSYCVLKVTDSTKDAVIGAELAEKLKIQPNQKLKIFLFLNGQVKSFQMIPSKFIKTGLYDYDASLIQVPVDFLKGYGFKPNVLEVKLRDVFSSDEVASEIRKKLGDDFKVLSWQEANQTLFEALSLERKVAFLTVLLLFFIAGLNVATVLSLLVSERKLDIAVLRTCGAKTKSLLLIFLSEGLILSFLGAVIGLGMSFFLNFLVNYFELLHLPASVYTVSRISLRIEYEDVLLSVGVAVGFAVIASFYPAFTASRLKPAEILRRL